MIHADPRYSVWKNQIEEVKTAMGRVLLLWALAAAEELIPLIPGLERTQWTRGLF